MIRRVYDWLVSAVETARILSNRRAMAGIREGEAELDGRS